MLEARVFGPRWECESPRVALDVALIHEELRRPGVTLSLLWQEYLAANPGDTATASTASITTDTASGSRR